MAHVRVRFNQLKRTYGYTVFHKILDPNIIFSLYGLCSPNVLFQCKTIEEAEETRIQKSEKQIAKRNKKDKFYKKLEDSILQKGIRNPIILYARKELVKEKLPPVYRKQGINLLCVHGCSRLYFAQKHNLQISCVICNWGTVNDKGGKIIHSDQEFYRLYKDRPIYELTEYGIRIYEIKNVIQSKIPSRRGFF